jgi:hypothetical protein
MSPDEHDFQAIALMLRSEFERRPAIRNAVMAGGNVRASMKAALSKADFFRTSSLNRARPRKESLCLVTV